MTRSNSTPTPHKQVLAKVNAYVDENIKELVEILNTFDGVRTFESCQGSKGVLGYIYFEYDKNGYWDVSRLGRGEFVELAGFVDRLAKSYSRLAIVENAKTRTASNPTGIGMTLQIMMDWTGRMDTPYIKLCIPYNQVKSVTDIFSHLAKQFARHMENKRESNH